MNDNIPEDKSICFLVQKLLSGKWTIMILYHLVQRPFRTGELQRALPNITQSALIKQLRSLEEQGLVERTIYKEVPPKVEYSLTNIGEEFKKVLDSLENFGQFYIENFEVN